MSPKGCQKLVRGTLALALTLIHINQDSSILFGLYICIKKVFLRELSHKKLYSYNPLCYIILCTISLSCTLRLCFQTFKLSCCLFLCFYECRLLDFQDNARKIQTHIGQVICNILGVCFGSLAINRTKLSDCTNHRT